jgi:hypothetical protein
MTQTASYLYAITRPVEPDALTGLRGIAGGAVRAVCDGDVACLVSTVPLDEFGEDALRRNLENLAWLERTAREHDSVVQAASRDVTTAPLRLATICRDDDAVVDRLHALHGRAAAVLARLEGRIEWGVKVYAPADRPEEGDDSADQPKSGTEYLQRRRQAITGRHRRQAVLSRVADDVYDRLGTLAIAGCRHRPQDQRLSGADAEMLLNAAYLVDVDHSAEFAAAVDDLAAETAPARIALTGPWPAYSFAVLDES